MQVPIVKINHKKIKARGVELYLKREDMLHPHISGNKIRKLKYNLQQAQLEQKDTLLTFGGAFSNHIFAMAAAGNEYGFKTIGILRGEEHQPLNPTLKFAVAQGMQLEYFSREKYRRKYEPEIINALRSTYGNFYLVPEGGTNRLALPGCTEIWQDLGQSYDFLCVPVGTGGTLAGLISGIPAGTKVVGFPVLKGGEYLVSDIEMLLEEVGQQPSVCKDKWQLITNYHFGGYARFNQNLIDFINAFKIDFDIPLDPIYTGKMMFGIMDLIEKDFFPEGSNILALHTGGLQGIAGFNQRFGNLIEV